MTTWFAGTYDDLCEEDESRGLTPEDRAIAEAVLSQCADLERLRGIERRCKEAERLAEIMRR